MFLIGRENKNLQNSLGTVLAYVSISALQAQSPVGHHNIHTESQPNDFSAIVQGEIKDPSLARKNLP